MCAVINVYRENFDIKLNKVIMLVRVFELLCVASYTTYIIYSLDTILKFVKT